MKIRCKKCGDIIQSKHKHDFQTCKCMSIFIQGENEYSRIGFPFGNPDDWYERVENNEIKNDKIKDNKLKENKYARSM
jgi:hypothetical protein